jgi:hypothetical protein
LHHHHEVHHHVQGDAIDQTIDCFSCDLSDATLDGEPFNHTPFAFYNFNVSSIEGYIKVLKPFLTVIFSSLRGPPATFFF